MLIPYIENIFALLISSIIMTAIMPPTRENISEENPPKNDVRRHLRTRIAKALLNPIKNRANILTTLASPSFMPGIGTISPNGMNLSVYERAAARAISIAERAILYDDVFFISYPTITSTSPEPVIRISIRFGRQTMLLPAPLIFPLVTQTPPGQVE